MKTRILALTGALLLLGAFPAVAGTNKFSVTLKDDGAEVGKLSFKIKTNKKGVATKITSMKATGLETKCLSEAGVAPGATITGKITGKVKVFKTKAAGGKTVYAFNASGLKGPGFFFSFSGGTNKKGTKVKNARLTGSDADPSPPSCTHQPDDFNAKRK